MSEISKDTLRSLRDFIGDALSDPEITPSEIASAIRDELNDLIEYHQVARAQAEKTLSLLDGQTESSSSFNDFVFLGGESSNDTISFELNSDYLNQAAQPIDYDNFSWGKDVIDFGEIVDKKKNRKDWDIFS